MDATTSFQQRVKPWMDACFGHEISADKVERNHRFLEEALELVQAIGCTQSEAHQLVDYVYGRPQGDINQEVGGVMVTLAALCLANEFDMHSAGEGSKPLARRACPDKIEPRKLIDPRNHCVSIEKQKRVARHRIDIYAHNVEPGAVKPHRCAASTTEEINCFRPHLSSRRSRGNADG